MNREECGAPKRQRKSVVRATAENWGRKTGQQVRHSIGINVFFHQAKNLTED